MKRLSTQCMDGHMNKTEKSPSAEKSMPSRKTLDFLTRFSRAYHAETNIRQNICGIVLN